MSPVVSFQVVRGAENLTANGALVTLAVVFSVNMLLQVGLGRVRLFAVRALMTAAVCYKKVFY